MRMVYEESNKALTGMLFNWMKLRIPVLLI